MIECEEPIIGVGQSLIRGEVNVAKFLDQRLNGIQNYSALEEALLDDCHTNLLWGSTETAQEFVSKLETILAKRQHLSSSSKLGMTDFVIASALKSSSFISVNKPTIKKWMNSCLQVFGSSGSGTAPASTAEAKERLHAYLSSQGIRFDNIDHPEVLTVEAMMPHLKNVKGAVTKNLFLKDKSKNLYLLSALHDRKVDLKDIAKKIGAKEIRFGDENVSLFISFFPQLLYLMTL